MNFVPSVMSSNYGVVTTSRRVAQGLGKRHDHVVRDLKNILKGIPKSGDTSKDVIIPSFYTNKQNKQQYEEFLLKKDGFILYMFNIQGYLDFKLAYIQKFNEMEAQLAKTTINSQNTDFENYIKEVKLNLKQMEVLELTTKRLLNCATMSLRCASVFRGYVLEALDKVKDNVDTNKFTNDVLVKDYAKSLAELGYTFNERSLYKWFRDNEYIRKDSTEPFEQYITSGLFVRAPRVVRDLTGFTTKVTPKGQQYFLNLFGTPQMKLEVDIPKNTMEKIKKLGLDKDEVLEKAVKKEVKKKKKKK